VLLGERAGCQDLLAELVGEALVLHLGLGEFDQELAHRGVARGLGGAPVEPCRLVFHILGELAHLVEVERVHEPQWLLLNEALHILAADQRQIFAELRAVEVEQHGAVAHLLLRHLVEDLGRGGICLAQPLGEATIDAAILVLVGDGQRENLLFGEFGKTFHGPALVLSYVRTLLDSKAALLTSRRRSLAVEGDETGMKRPSLDAPRRALERGWRRVLHTYWRFARAMTLGVRALVIDEEGRVSLVKHSYVSGWHLPGGGVEAGETISEALARELQEEGNIEMMAAPQLH